MSSVTEGSLGVYSWDGRSKTYIGTKRKRGVEGLQEKENTPQKRLASLMIDPLLHKHGMAT